MNLVLHTVHNVFDCYIISEIKINHHLKIALLLTK